MKSSVALKKITLDCITLCHLMSDVFQSSNDSTN
jgi:hypothetical protein